MIMQDIVDYAKVFPGYTRNISIDIIREDSETICFRTATSEVINSRFLDGGYIGEFNFEILCKSKDARNAINQIDDYKVIFDIKESILFTDVKVITITPITDGRIVTQTEQGEEVYGSEFRLEYYKGKV